jgi:phosphoserine phosphatase
MFTDSRTPEGIDYEYRKRMLDFYLNADFVPRTDYSFKLGKLWKYPYLGMVEGSHMKGIALDFDGIVNRPDATELYKEVVERLAEKNGIFRKRLGDMDACFRRLKLPESVPEVETEIGRILTSSGLTRAQYLEANEEAANDFLKDSLTYGVKEYVRKTKEEMGYITAVISGGFHDSLKIVCREIGIPAENVYGTEILFHRQNIEARLMLGDNRVRTRDVFLDAKNIILKENAGVQYGCYFSVDDNPTLSRPSLKTGLNPSIIAGDFQREELPFDVTTTCKGARENMLKLIEPMYKFEYGWVSTHVTDVETQHRTNALCCDLMEYMADTVRFESVKAEFVKKAFRVLEIKEKHHLTYDAPTFRRMLGMLLVESEPFRIAGLANEVFGYLRHYVPEMNAERDMLEDIVQDYRRRVEKAN